MFITISFITSFIFDFVSSLTEIMWRRKQILPQRKPPTTTLLTKQILPQRKPPQQPPCWRKISYPKENHPNNHPWRKHILPQRKPPQQPPCWRKHILPQTTTEEPYPNPNSHPAEENILPQRKPPQQPPCWRKHILPQRKPSCWRKHILPQRKPPQQPPCWRKHILPQRKSDPTALSSKFWSPNMVLDQKMVNYKCEVLQRTTKNLQILFCWFLKEQSCCFWYICQVWFLC